MGKNSLLSAKHLSKNNVALFAIAAMFAGFLCSRSIASVGMMLFAANAVRDINPRKWITQKWWLLGVVWVGMYLLSWFWSANKDEWYTLCQTKLPFLVLPLAFGFLKPWTKNELRVYTILLTGCMLLGACYSLSFFLRDTEGFIHGYKYSHTLPTPAYNDHISFSTAVAACIAWGCYSWRLWESRIARILLGLALAFLSYYLYLLAAKTGLLALLVFSVAIVIYYVATGHWKKGIVLLLVIAGSVYGAYRCVPTFRERIGYMSYTWLMFRQGERTGLYSDMGRIISYDIAGKLVKEHPVIGVGAGDMLDEMNNGYNRWYPQVAPQLRLIPHNQFLTVALGIGIPAMLLFTVWIVLPLRRVRRTREGAFFIATWVMLLVPLFTDPFLEVQFGVFVYLFFLLMQRSVLPLREPGK